MIGISCIATASPRPPASRSRSGGRLPARGTLLLARDLLLEARARHLVDAEGREQLAQDVVGRQVAVLELLEVRLDLRFDEAPHRVADHLVLLAPLDHGYSSRFAARGARSTISVISAGANRRIGGPQNPVPRLT